MLASRFSNIFPDLTNEESNSSLLALLAKKDCYSVFVETLTKLAIMLNPIEEMKTLIIYELFRNMTSKNQWLSAKNMLNKVVTTYID